MKQIYIIPVIFLFFHCSLIAQQNISAKNQFRASVVKINITPEKPEHMRGYNPRVSTGVHDSIYHRIFLMDDGKTLFAIVSTETCLYSPSEYDKLAGRVLKETGIEPLNFWWTYTHTHSAPEVGEPGLSKVFLGDRFHHKTNLEYTNWIEQEIIDGINEAKAKLAPASLGVGWGFSRANINRRAKDVDGTVSLGMDPDAPVDRKIGLIRIDKYDGSPMVLLANYAIHGTVLGDENLLISGDAPGVVSEYVEQEIGAPLIFINGAAGNIAPLYSICPNPKKGHLGQFRVLLGDKIIEANNNICNTTTKIELKSNELVVETPRKAGLGWPSDCGKYNRTTNTGENLIRLPVRFLSINEDIAIWSLPVELFCEISNEIRQHSPYPYTFYFGFTNGWLGYLCTKSEYEQGGYEPGVSPFSSHAENDVKSAVLSYLDGKLKE